QPEPVAEPDHDSIGPHMAYAVQWWLFAAAVPVGWLILVRREKRDRDEESAKAASEPATAAA
ncbi:SURF1 family protein, partial [Streptomyces cirratus]